jgi:hypothetical protein
LLHWCHSYQSIRDAWEPEVKSRCLWDGTFDLYFFDNRFRFELYFDYFWSLLSIESTYLRADHGLWVGLIGTTSYIKKAYFI